MHCLRQARDSEESITSFGFAARFDADRRSFEQLQRHVKERCPIAAPKLKFDLADRLRTASIGSANFALIDRSLNSGAWMRRNFDQRPRDGRSENRT